jgi:hypothetical protein
MMREGRRGRKRKETNKEKEEGKRTSVRKEKIEGRKRMK